MQAELSRREKNLVEYTEEIGGIEKEIKEIEAHFAQTELLRFVLSERYDLFLAISGRTLVRPLFYLAAFIHYADPGPLRVLDGFFHKFIGNS